MRKTERVVAAAVVDGWLVVNLELSTAMFGKSVKFNIFQFFTVKLNYSHFFERVDSKYISFKMFLWN